MFLQYISSLFLYILIYATNLLSIYSFALLFYHLSSLSLSLVVFIDLFFLVLFSHITREYILILSFQFLQIYSPFNKSSHLSLLVKIHRLHRNSYVPHQNNQFLCNFHYHFFYLLI